LSDSGRTTAVTISAVVPRSGQIQVDEQACLACRECEVACSLSHERECNPALSSIQVDFDDFRPGFPDIRVCKQCDWPACYYACAARHEIPAIAVDPATGARFVDQAKCNGCGACARACPLTPERPVIFSKRVDGKKRFYKCDLCMGRPEGPVCVQICPGKCLTLVPAERRRA
jgi:Fe-S-cluster-containing hydrogenase component 2